MYNIIFSGFIHPLFGIFSGLLLIFGSEYVGKFILKKISYKFFFLNLSFGVIFVSLFTYLCLLSKISQYFIFIFCYLILIFGLINIYSFSKKIKFNFKLPFYFYVKLPFYFYVFFIFYILLFFISISAPTMTDALDYHLLIPRHILFFNEIPNPIIFKSSSLSGLGEIYNYIGLVVYSDVAGSLLQFIALISFSHYFYRIIKNQKKYIIFCLFILGSPVLIYFISGAKYNLFPQLISTIILFILISNKKIDFKISILIIFLIFGIINFKLNFIITGAILGIFLLSKCKINLQLINSAFFLFVLFFIPKAFYNFIQLENFSYFNFFTTADYSFLQFLKNYVDNSIFFPLSLFIPDSIGKISTVLGFSIIILFLNKKNNSKNIQIILITFIGFISYSLLSQKTGRVFYELLLWLSLNIIYIRKYIINIYIIKYFLLLNFAIPLLMSFVGFAQLAPSVLSNEFRKKILRLNAFEYKGIEWISQNIPLDSTILTNLRSQALLNHKFLILRKSINNDKLYYNYLLKNEIDFIVIRINHDIYMDQFFIKDCKPVLIKKSPRFVIENRNFFNRNSFYNIAVYKLDNVSFKNCIKTQFYDVK